MIRSFPSLPFPLLVSQEKAVMFLLSCFLSLGFLLVFIPVHVTADEDRVSLYRTLLKS